MMMQQYLVYLGIFLYLAASLLVSHRLSPNLDKTNWLASFFIVSLFVGLRSGIGPDWKSYLSLYELYSSSILSLDSVISFVVNDDLLFVLITKLSSATDIGIYGVNFICGVVFLYGLMRLCSVVPNKWASFLMVFAVYTVPIAMGTVRQSLALGFYFLGLSFLPHLRLRLCATNFFLGALSHKSIIPFAILFMGLTSWGFFCLVAFILFVVFFGIPLMPPSASVIYDVYVEGAMSSNGVYYRLLICLMPSILFFIVKPQCNSLLERYNLILIVVGIIMVIAVPYAPSLIDRFGLYLSPLLIWSAGSGAHFLSKYVGRFISNFLVLILSASVLFTWLVYSPNSSSWVPYCNILFGGYCE